MYSWPSTHINPISAMRYPVSCSPIALAFLVSLSLNVSAHNSTSCCASLVDALPGQVTFPGTEAFSAEQQSYYSLFQTDISPACRVAPDTAEDVSKIVTIAVEGQCKFAIHSGGHTQERGVSNIDESGFTIDLTALNWVDLSDDESSVRVGPGQRWDHVYTPLHERNLTIAGGRDPGVGVGGFLLGGGISFLSFEHGLGADNVIDYEIVIATGEIIHANQEENADLWWALKVGRNNFGIVTAFTLKVYPVGPVWAGFQIFDIEDSPRLLENFAAHSEEANGNPEAAFSQVFYLSDGGNYSCKVPMVFNTEQPEPALWKTLTEGVEPLVDNMEVQTLLDALETIRDNSQTRTMSYSRNTLANGTFHYEHWLKGKELFEAERVANVSGLFWATGAQPWPTNYFQPNSPIASNNANETQMLLVVHTSWENAEDDEAIEAVMAEYLEWIEDTAEERGILRPFMYLNYVDISQPIYESSLAPEDLAKMKEIQAFYDPDLVFRKLVPGGVKLPN